MVPSPPSAFTFPLMQRVGAPLCALQSPLGASWT